MLLFPALMFSQTIDGYFTTDCMTENTILMVDPIFMNGEMLPTEKLNWEYEFNYYSEFSGNCFFQETTHHNYCKLSIPVTNDLSEAKGWIIVKVTQDGKLLGERKWDIVFCKNAK